MAVGHSGVTVRSLRDGLLAPLAAIPQLASFPDTSIHAHIIAAEAEVERLLGTRFGVTRFLPYRDAAEPPAPIDELHEYEPLYDWPGRIPGDGFPRLKPRVRPIVEVVSLSLSLPGAIISEFVVPLNWLRVDRLRHELLVAPSGGQAAYALAYGQGMMNWRLPSTCRIEYRAGLDEAGLEQWPQIQRLVELKAVLKILPTASMWLNPTALASVSADGLSQSRNSGYVWKDMADQFQAEADALRDEVLNRWDGTFDLIVL